MADTISDFITIIRNASRVRNEFCTARYSKVHWSIAQILKDEGYIRAVTENKDENGFKNIVIELKYVDDVPVITGIKRWSKPGCRAYFGYSEIPRVLNGLGLGILTTSSGFLRDREARQRKIGGELICTVW